MEDIDAGPFETLEGERLDKQVLKRRLVDDGGMIVTSDAQEHT